jgi:hypothetical protein
MPRCCSPLLVGRPRTLMNLFNSAQRMHAQWEFGSFASQHDCRQRVPQLPEEREVAQIGPVAASVAAHLDRRNAEGVPQIEL